MQGNQREIAGCACDEDPFQSIHSTGRDKMRQLRRYSLFFVLLIFSSTGFPQTTASDRDVERKIDSLLALMTPAEKIGQLNLVGVDWTTRWNAISQRQRDMVRAGRLGGVLNAVGFEPTADLQHIAMEKSRLKIPLLFGLDVIHGFRTVFPIPLAEASTWDPELIEKASRVAATEASAAGINWTFAPMVDIARDPRWGRIAEGSGEDPFLGSVMAAARVRGFQGESLKDPTSLLACPKHYVAYGGAEAGRDYNTVDISERTLRETYLPPFKAAVEAGAGSLMSAFNEIGGVPSSANAHTLTEILRGEWGFDGFVVSDWTAIAELIPHGIARDSTEAGIRALTAGVDMDMASLIYEQYLPAPISQRTLSAKILDDAVRRVLRTKFKLGLFDNPFRHGSPEREKSAILTQENIELARRIACESIVLLKNEKKLLPLSKNLETIAVLGPLSDDGTQPLGPWSGLGKKEEVITALQGIRESAASKSVILTSRGCDVTGDSRSGFDEARELARRADVAIVVLGETAAMSGEAASRSNIGLPGMQEEFLKAICETGTPVVLVLMNGRPLAIQWEANNVQAILETWFLGVQTGKAIADVIFGDVNPSAKLPVTFPRSVGQIPVYYNHKNTGRPFGEDNEYTSKYLDIPDTPLYPFGYGLSYTSFTYSRLRVVTPKVRRDDHLKISVDVTNSGDRKGDEVVQLYIRDDVASITRPVKELKGFERISLDPGQTRTVMFSIRVNQLGFYDASMKYVVEPGAFTVFVGGNSVQTLEEKFEVVSE
jgi:beta-glucosidase